MTRYGMGHFHLSLTLRNLVTHQYDELIMVLLNMCSVGNTVGKTWKVCSGDFGHYVELLLHTWSPLDPWKYQ